MRLSPWLVSLCVLGQAVNAAAEPTLHPKATVLPSAHQGPFVTTADGGVLCIDSQSALSSTDEGQTWTTTPLFSDAERFQVATNVHPPNPQRNRNRRLDEPAGEATRSRIQMGR